MIITSVVNEKGGVGKTTTTINVAAGLAQQGKRVLIVDLDSSGNATNYIHRQEYTGGSINDLLYFMVSGVPFDMAQYILHNPIETVDYIPATKVLASAPGILANDRDSSMVLARLLRTPYFRDHYDYILLDCKPSLDLLVVNALAASDKIIIPVNGSDFSVDGLAALWSTVERVRQSFNENLAINGILLTKVNRTRNKPKQIEMQLRDVFGDLVYKTVLPDLAEAENAVDDRISMVNHSDGEIGRMYLELVKEVLERD